MTRTTLAISIGTLLLAAAARADGPTAVAPAGPGYAYGPGYGYGSPRHSSTVAEGYLRGAADFTRAAGYFNYWTSEALKNIQAARSMYLDNRVKATQVYFQMREMNRQYRAAERGPRPTPEDHARYAKMGAPQPLPAELIDPFTGKIYWPGVLNDEYFADYRARLNVLLTTPQPGSPQEIQAAGRVLLEILADRVHLYNPSDYIAARRFVESLAYYTPAPAPAAAPIAAR
jgi:hypothetical protein